MLNSASFTPAQITAQVNKISRSSTLKNSPVLCQFLQFVVDETLEGNGERIKEYTIGTKVLGRKSDFDPQLDAIVRIHAGRLRRALNEFYSGEGKGDTMRISIPKGGYTPNFASNGLREDLFVRDATTLNKSRKPVLAVMPFRSINQAASYDSFCEEVGEFASTELARFQELSVICYSSCVNAANKFKDTSDISSSLGAEYILTGSIFVDRKNLRMLLQLSRCDSGRQLWSHTFTHKINQGTLFEFQEEAVNLIAGAIGGYYGAIYRDAIETSRNGTSADKEIYDVIFWYDQFIKQLDKDTFDKACAALEDTVKKDSEYALAWAVLSELYSMGAGMNFKRLDDQQETAITLAHKAINLDPKCQHAYQALARSCLLGHNKDGVVSASEQCYALNPRAASFSARVGTFLVYAGEFERGASILKESLKSNPYFPWTSSLALSLYHYHRNEFHLSEEWAERTDMPQFPWVCMIKAASLAQLGRMEESKKQIELLLTLKPDITVLGKPYIGSFILDENLVNDIIVGLEKTGLIINSNPLLVSS
jgi:TolB-like protein